MNLWEEPGNEWMIDHFKEVTGEDINFSNCSKRRIGTAEKVLKNKYFELKSELKECFFRSKYWHVINDRLQLVIELSESIGYDIDNWEE